MANMVDVKARASASMYRELPDGFRTTFVVGMCDMINYLIPYIASEHRPRFESIVDFCRELDSGTVREKFDLYVNDNPQSKDLAAAGYFFLALNQWSGFDAQ